MVVGSEAASSKLFLQGSLTGRDHQPTPAPRSCLLGTAVPRYLGLALALEEPTSSGRCAVCAATVTSPGTLGWLIGAVPSPMSRVQNHLHHAHPSSFVVPDGHAWPQLERASSQLQYLPRRDPRSECHKQNTANGTGVAQLYNAVTNKTCTASRF